MKPVALCGCLLALTLAGCGLAPSAGPLAGEVKAQAHADRDILYDVVKVDDHVVRTLLAQPRDSLAARFKKYGKPPEPRLAVGDTVAVLIWEAGSGGLFTGPAPQLPGAPGAQPGEQSPAQETAPQGQPSELDRMLGLPAQPPEGATSGEPPSSQLFPNPSETGQTSSQLFPNPSETGRPPSAGSQPGGAPPGEQPAAGQPAAPFSESVTDAMTAAAQQERGVRIPPQPVGRDGGITVPFAGRVPAAGRTAAEVQRAIERRLADKALSPQALVLVLRSPANAVTVAAEGEGARRVPLAGGGERLLQVIAAAGGAGVPVHEVFVRLSRGGITATIPYATLVANPAEDIYAQPGDILTLVRIPKTYSVFGAAGRNRAITFGAPRLTVTEALAKAHGLRDDLANPAGVFLFRYEPDAIVRALDQPIATRAGRGVSPIVYRFNFRNAASYFAAQQFPVQDKDIIFVADADVEPLQKVLNAVSEVTGAVYNGYITCVSANC